MYKVKKDFLDKDIADNIETKLLGWTFPWYYHSHVAQKGDNEFAFFHTFWNQEEFGNRSVSNFLDIVKPLIEKKDPLVLPPDFSELPKPNEQPETVDEEVDIKSVFDGEQSSTEEDNNQNSSKSNIKKSISDKIQKQ